MRPKIHLLTYDFAAINSRYDQNKRHRRSGLVTHSGILIDGLLSQGFQLTVTQTGTETFSGLYRRKDLVFWGSGINTHHPLLLDNNGNKSRERIYLYCETKVKDEDNPVWKSFAAQFAVLHQRSKASIIIAQNPNPAAIVLKSAE